MFIYKSILEVAEKTFCAIIINFWDYFFLELLVSGFFGLAAFLLLDCLEEKMILLGMKPDALPEVSWNQKHCNITKIWNIWLILEETEMGLHFGLPLFTHMYGMNIWPKLALGSIDGLFFEKLD